MESQDFWRYFCLSNIVVFAEGIAMVSLCNVLLARFTSYGVLGVAASIMFALAIIIQPTDPVAPFFPFMFSKVCMAHLGGQIADYELWWAFAPLAWIAASLALHLKWQKLKPLY
jgi:hypothetical protein